MFLVNSRYPLFSATLISFV